MPGRCTDSLLQYGDRQVREQAPQPQFLAAWRRLEGCPWSSGRWRQISDDERGTYRARVVGVVYVGTKQEEEWLADEYEYGSRKRVVVMFERGKAVGVLNTPREVATTNTPDRLFLEICHHTGHGRPHNQSFGVNERLMQHRLGALCPREDRPYPTTPRA